MSLIRKLASRKFLLALGAVITMVANEQYAEAVVVVMGYLGVEGYLDKAAI